MATSYLTRTLKTPVPQSQPYSPNQVENEAGGYVFKVDPFTYLRRFLALGSESGNFYVNERDFTKQNIDNVKACIVSDGKRVVDTIVELSNANASAKPDTLLFTLALCMQNGDLDTRRAAGEAVSVVCNTGYKLLKFVDFVENTGGWGRLKRRSVSNWFTSQDVRNLSYQVAKYQNRDGWTMADVLRVVHPKTESENLNQVFKWVVDGVVPSDRFGGDVFKTIVGMEILRNQFNENSTNFNAFIDTIRRYDLPRECIPTELLNKKEIQLVLMEHMPFTALIRNLGNLSRIGAIDSNNEYEVAKKIVDGSKRARVHPLNVLAAFKTYGSGSGVRSSNSWTVYPKVVDALNDAFYESFNNVEQSDKRYLIGIDVSGSMYGSRANGMPYLDLQEAASVMAMATLAATPNSTVVVFDTAAHLADISPKRRLDDAVAFLRTLGRGGTDLAQPVLYALNHNIKVDCFVTLSDNESWSGNRHHVDVMNEYRSRFNPNARFVNVQMTPNNYSVADQEDPLSMEVVGLSPEVPKVITDFAEGRI